VAADERGQTQHPDFELGGGRGGKDEGTSGGVSCSGRRKGVPGPKNGYMPIDPSLRTGRPELP